MVDIVGFFAGSEAASKMEKSKLLNRIVKHYQPSMRLVDGTAITMDASEGRKTAKIYGQEETLVTSEDTSTTNC